MNISDYPKYYLEKRKSTPNYGGTPMLLIFKSDGSVFELKYFGHWILRYDEYSNYRYRIVSPSEYESTHYDCRKGYWTKLQFDREFVEVDETTAINHLESLKDFPKEWIKTLIPSSTDPTSQTAVPSDHQAECDHCHKTYYRKTAKSRYCSDSCRVMAHKKRQRDHAPAPEPVEARPEWFIRMADHLANKLDQPVNE